MARTKAISLIQSGSTKADLAELSGLVIANIQKDTLAQGLKSQAYTGNPASGSVEFKRFKNSASQPYGTARTANKGTAITVPPTPVNLDTHREIVEEAAKFDLDTFGVTNIMARRADNHVDTVAAEFDAAFFQTAFDAGTAYTPDASATIEEILEGLIQSVETVKNDYVRGVPRNLIRLVLDPVTYDRMEKIDTASTAAAWSTGAKGIANNLSQITGKLDSLTSSWDVSRSTGTINGGDLDSVGSVGKIDSDVNIADEDLKFLRDVAEMRYVQNFVTLTPTVAMDAQISERVDLDDVVSAIERKLEGEFIAAAEGVYN